ncbi:MAG TPA: M3 family peptidase, partial [Bacteroidales bacterium]|nr:M3 family peptidase [Bacteroidales bacterium]
MENPLRSAWNTPFGTPPFDLIKIEHFIPAIEEAISSAMEEIKTIIADAEPPSFENTIIRLDRSGTRLADISAVLYNLNSAETNKELQSVAQAASPILARFSNDITMNEDLFRKVKSLCCNVPRPR